MAAQDAPRHRMRPARPRRCPAAAPSAAARRRRGHAAARGTALSGLAVALPARRSLQPDDATIAAAVGSPAPCQPLHGAAGTRTPPPLVGLHQRRRVAHACELDQPGRGPALAHGLCGGRRQQVGLLTAQQQRRQRRRSQACHSRASPACASSGVMAPKGHGDGRVVVRLEPVRAVGNQLRPRELQPLLTGVRAEPLRHRPQRVGRLFERGQCAGTPR
jgi:hypothetical protein